VLVKGNEQLRQIEEQKKNWEMKRMAAMSGNDNECFDPLTGEPDSNGLLTYNDAVNQVKKKKPGRPRTKSNLSQSAAVAALVVTLSSKQVSPVKGNSGKWRSGRKQNHQAAIFNDPQESFHSKELLLPSNVSVESEDRPAFFPFSLNYQSRLVLTPIRSLVYRLPFAPSSNMCLMNKV